MASKTDSIRDRIAPLQQQIIQHPLYSAITDLEDLGIFMQYHVYAVWDFMSLLKALQRELTCVQVPWFPVGNADTRYLINEIVTGEESDVDPEGNRMSHFELYLKAMEQSGTDTEAIQSFLSALRSSRSLSQAFEASSTPAAARNFVNYTFQVIASGQPHVMAAVFTFGREDLIPDMFYAMVKDLKEHFPQSVNLIHYYLERHIEVDGDHHSKLALQMTEQLCGNDEEKWKAAEEAVVKALEARKSLWDGALKAIMLKKEVAVTGA